MQNIFIRKITILEAPALLSMSRQTFFDAFYHLNDPEDMDAYASKSLTLKNLLGEMTTPGSAFFWALVENEFAGYIKLNTADAQNEFQLENAMELERLYVLSKYQRQRIGEQMLSFAFNEANKAMVDFIWLGVWEHNKPAINFYSRAGFEVCGSHDFILGNDRQTDLLMKKTL